MQQYKNYHLVTWQFKEIILTETNTLRYEMTIVWVRIFVSFATWYESSNDDINSPWYESSMVRIL